MYNNNDRSRESVLVVSPNSASGKKSLVQALAGKTFGPDLGITHGVCYDGLAIAVDGVTIQVDFWTITSRGGSHTLVSPYLQNAKMILCLIDPDPTRVSVTEITNYYQEIAVPPHRGRIPAIIVFTKSDLKQYTNNDNERKVTTYFQTTHPDVKIINTSAKTKHNIDLLRKLIGECLLSADREQLYQPWQAVGQAPPVIL